MDANDLTARYVHAVVRLLPKGDRDDVAAELGTLVEETLQERARAAGRPADEALALDVLNSFGPPEAMADQYGQPPRWLLGPSYLPAYFVTLKVVAAVVIGVSVFSFVWSFGGGQPPWSDAFLTFAGTLTGLAATLLVNVGLITIVFAALERVHPSRPQVSDWDPLQLPAVDDPDRVDRADRVTEIGFDVIQLVLFNGFAHGRLAMLAMGAAPSAFHFTSGFARFIPWINLMFVARIGVGVLLLRHGRWNRMLRAADLVVGAYTLTLFLQILAGGDIVASQGLSTLIKLVLASLTVVSVFDVARQGWRLVRFEKGGPSALGSRARIV